MAQYNQPTFAGNDSEISFCKMHGLGNDYIYIDCCFDGTHNDFRKKFINSEEKLRLTIQRLCDRHFGIGADGIIFITKPAPELLDNNNEATNTPHCQMEMYNSDGSRSEMCGNGLRCVAQYACDEMTKRKVLEKQEYHHVFVQSNLGRKVYDCLCFQDDGKLLVQIEMGQLLTKTYNFNIGDGPFGLVPELPLEDIKLEGFIRKIIFKANLKLSNQDSHQIVLIPLYCLSVPNPHAICFINEVRMDGDLSSPLSFSFDDYPVCQLGTQIENCTKLFPQRTNVEFVEIVDKHNVVSARQRTWERGSGETNACGTGAYAVSQIIYNKLVTTTRHETDRIKITLTGGDLFFKYSSNQLVHMIGPVKYVCKGTFMMNDYA